MNYKVTIPRRLFFKTYYFNNQTNAYKAVGLLRTLQQKRKLQPFQIHVQGPHPFTNTEIFEAS